MIQYRIPHSLFQKWISVKSKDNKDWRISLSKSSAQSKKLSSSGHTWTHSSRTISRWTSRKCVVSLAWVRSLWTLSACSTMGGSNFLLQTWRMLSQAYLNLPQVASKTMCNQRIMTQIFQLPLQLQLGRRGQVFYQPLTYTRNSMTTSGMLTIVSTWKDITQVFWRRESRWQKICKRQLSGLEMIWLRRSKWKCTVTSSTWSLRMHTWKTPNYSSTH